MIGWKDRVESICIISLYCFSVFCNKVTSSHGSKGQGEKVPAKLSQCSKLSGGTLVQLIVNT